MKRMTFGESHRPQFIGGMDGFRLFLEDGRFTRVWRSLGISLWPCLQSLCPLVWLFHPTLLNPSCRLPVSPHQLHASCPQLQGPSQPHPSLLIHSCLLSYHPSLLSSAIGASLVLAFISITQTSHAAFFFTTPCACNALLKLSCKALFYAPSFSSSRPRFSVMPARNRPSNNGENVGILGSADMY